MHRLFVYAHLSALEIGGRLRRRLVPNGVREPSSTSA
jgi:hypothetical protein